MPSTPPPFPPPQFNRPALSPRKLILSVLLVFSIIFFFLILFAGLFAVIQEAAPHNAPRLPILVAIKHVIAHPLQHFYHRK
jgi:hypothetical protein